MTSSFREFINEADEALKKKSEKSGDILWRFEKGL